ncbi:uncharacterized protein LOC131957810, partial [Physella acuta]|uniref:uncharacterized protein LOC131957810 n=1 Tax=Physella acuta TaxID=109671 RepID=UPI0027DB6028
MPLSSVYNPKQLCLVLLLIAFAGVLVMIYVIRPDVQFVTTAYNRSLELLNEPESSRSEHFLQQRNLLSGTLNHMMMLYGQQSCEMLKLKQMDAHVSEHGGWCAEASSPGSSSHKWDQRFSRALSKFFKGKSVGSFGDGPGAYKRHLDTLKEVKSYTAYDGAPYCELVTNGTVIFLDLTVPQYNLPIFDWVISVEVGEHIPAKFEDIYLDNLARHAREGIVLSWAVPGQGGLSHVNTKPLEAVKDQMKKRGFLINLSASTPLREAATFYWLKANVYVYNRLSLSSLVEEDA